MVFVQGEADLLSLAEELPHRGDGSCGGRSVRLDPTESAFIPSATLFPFSFPRDFSVLTVMRTNTSGTLFTMYDERGIEQTAVSFGTDRLNFLYQPQVGDRLIVSFPVHLTDNR